MRPLVLALALLAASASAQTGCYTPPSDPPAEGQEEAALDTTVMTLLLGETAIDVVWHRAGDAAAPLVMLNLHDDESTSVDAALDVVRESGGTVVEVVHTGERNVTFDVNGDAFRADPNRMFTPAGRARTLGALSVAREDAVDALAEFAEAVLRNYVALDPAVVVTLHNNTEANYSVRSYLAGGDYETDAEAATLHEGSDPDDFFFVTDRALYDALVARGFNAVLQDNDAATDDGSLSVWAAQNGRPYVNVEAQHGHREEQARMIRALVEVLNER